MVSLFFFGVCLTASSVFIVQRIFIDMFYMIRFCSNGCLRSYTVFTHCNADRVVLIYKCQPVPSVSSQAACCLSNKLQMRKLSSEIFRIWVTAAWKCYGGPTSTHMMQLCGYVKTRTSSRLLFMNLFFFV